jgi:hypothetical protein
LGKNGSTSPPPLITSLTIVELMCEKLGALIRKIVSNPPVKI